MRQRGGFAGAQTPPAIVETLPQEPAVLVGAGDIANCDLLSGSGAQATARVLDRIRGTVFTVGDHVYPAGTAEQYRDCYEPAWGRHKTRTRPSPGNHDYATSKASGYSTTSARTPGPDRPADYHSYDVGAWHVVSLNSSIAADGQSAQIQWLREDLAVYPSTCTLAYWHIPVFSSGAHGNDPRMLDVWKVLYEAGADVIVNGHDHDYAAVRPAGSERQKRSGPRHPCVRRRHGRRRRLPLQTHPAEQRSPQPRCLRRPPPDARSHELRMGFRARGRPPF